MEPPVFASFLGAGVTGLLLALRLDQGWDIPLSGQISFWHTEMGIVMVLIAFFHIAPHWKYYLSHLQAKKEK